MANNNDDKSKKGGMSPMMASLAGAAVGAAVGAGALILSDEKNRRKLESALEGLKKQGFNVLEIVQKEAQNVRNQLEPAKEGSRKEAKKPAAKSAKK